MIQSCWQITIELAPWLLLGTFIAALLHGLLPHRFVQRHLQGKGGVAKAVLLGIPLPLCSCGVIPAGLGLKKDGASNGASVGFLISTPQTGVDSILVSANFLGWPFALFKVFSATVTGMVGGYLTDKVEAMEGPMTAASDGTHDRSLQGMLDHGMQLLRSIWVWLLFGIMASAAIQIYIPDSWLTEMAAMGSIVACLAVLVFSIPLYVCATASVPIAAALVMKGVPASAALVFLMAGPASNLATIGAIHRGFGRQVVGIYLATIAIGSIGFGLAFDWVLTATATAMHTHHGDPSLLEILSASILLCLLAGFAWSDLRAQLRPKLGQDIETLLEVPVEGLTCGGCVRKLEGKLSDIPGVHGVQVQLEPGMARIQGSVPEATIRRAIHDAGFQPN